MFNSLSSRPGPQPQADHRWLQITLGMTTAPVMLGIMAAQSVGKWLQDLKMAEQGWWSEQRLPPLDPQMLQERQDRLESQHSERHRWEETASSSSLEEREVNLEDGRS